MTDIPGLETTAEERAEAANSEGAHPAEDFLSSLLRDFDRLSAALAVEKARYDALLTMWSESRDRHLAAEARLAEVEKALREYDRLSLVIESAVRNADPPNHGAILTAIKDGRAALAPNPEKTP